VLSPISYQVTDPSSLSHHLVCVKLLLVVQPWLSFPSPNYLDSTTKTAPTDSPSARIALQQRGLPLLRHPSHLSGQIRVGERFP
jgi:hypothetical protein